MRKTIEIDGKKYPYQGMTPDWRGIRVGGGKVFWLVTELRNDGTQAGSLPKMPPSSIRRISWDIPDLTDQYIGEVQAEFDALVKDCQKMTDEQLCKRFGWSRFSDGMRAAVQSRRKQLLKTSFKEWKQGPGRYNCWVRHGTPEIAKKHEFPDGLKKILIRKLSKRVQGDGCDEVELLKFVAYYDNPAKSEIYLYDVREDFDPSHNRATVGRVGAPNERDASSDKFKTLGRLKYLPGFNQVTLGGQFYNLSSRPKARACIKFLVERKPPATDSKSACHLEKEIDPFVRKECQLVGPHDSEIKIHHYFNPTKSNYAELRRALIKSAGRHSGSYYLNVQ